MKTKTDSCEAGKQNFNIAQTKQFYGQTTSADLNEASSMDKRSPPLDVAERKARVA